MYGDLQNLGTPIQGAASAKPTDFPEQISSAGRRLFVCTGQDSSTSMYFVG